MRTIEQLAALRAARLSRADLPASMTLREVDAYVAETTLIERRLLQAQSATATLASGIDVDIDTASQWLAHLTAWRAALCEQLLALPGRIRDAHTLGVQQNLKLSILSIDRGTDILQDSGYDLTTLRLGDLMRESGFAPVGANPDVHYSGRMPWGGSMPEVERRIADLERKRTAAQSALEDALLSDDERAARDAEAHARRTALNALPTRKVRGDGSMFDRYPDGRVVEVAQR